MSGIRECFIRQNVCRSSEMKDYTNRLNMASSQERGSGILHTHKEEEEEETGMIQPQVKECQQPPEVRR